MKAAPPGSVFPRQRPSQGTLTSPHPSSRNHGQPTLRFCLADLTRSTRFIGCVNSSSSPIVTHYDCIPESSYHVDRHARRVASASDAFAWVQTKRHALRRPFPCPPPASIYSHFFAVLASESQSPLVPPPSCSSSIDRRKERRRTAVWFGGGRRWRREQDGVVGVSSGQAVAALQQDRQPPRRRVRVLYVVETHRAGGVSGVCLMEKWVRLSRRCIPYKFNTGGGGDDLHGSMEVLVISSPKGNGLLFPKVWNRS